MAQQLNSAQAQAVLGCSHMTLLAWRRGSAKRDPLPTLKPKPNAPARVFFSALQLRKWAKKYGIELAQDPDALPLAQAPAKKPGPKGTSRSQQKPSKSTGNL